MLVYKIVSRREQADENDTQFEAFGSLLGAYRLDGHILGRELLTVNLERQIEAYVFAPAGDAFKGELRNEWVQKSVEEAKASGLSEPEFATVGDDLSEPDGCNCANSSWLTMFTTYIQIQSPVRCGDCFKPIPLYRLPRFKSGEFIEVISWADDYKACDSLFMNSATGERFGYREISQVESSLSRRGREICQHFERETGKPTCYYLHRYYGRSSKLEEARKCPGCGEGWRLPARLHNIFDFKCDKCRLVSNISYAVA